jgi:hypothetical protein
MSGPLSRTCGEVKGWALVAALVAAREAAGRCFEFEAKLAEFRS